MKSAVWSMELCCCCVWPLLVVNMTGSHSKDKGKSVVFVLCIYKPEIISKSKLERKERCGPTSAFILPAAGDGSLAPHIYL